MATHDLPSRGRAVRPSFTRQTTDSIVTTSRAPSAIVPRKKLSIATAAAPIPNPATLPSTWKRPTRADAKPTCFAGTRSGTYPWNGPWAKFALTWRRTMNAAIAMTVFDEAIPSRKTMSRIEPMKMYGLRRPQRLMV
jgi:hypothetical protein